MPLPVYKALVAKFTWWRQVARGAPYPQVLPRLLRWAQTELTVLEAAGEVELIIQAQQPGPEAVTFELAL